MSFAPSVVDISALRPWIGRSESATDLITPRLEASLRAICNRPVGEPAVGDLASLLVHWCLAPAIVPTSALGPDGHPARGGFMPPVPLPRRMWAGGELTFMEPLRVGDVVTRESQIEDVTLKSGRSGTLCFVTIRHQLLTERGLGIEERQDIVFRDNPGLGEIVVSKPPNEPERPAATWRHEIDCNPVLLFRYSALTFNGHRIHYDRAYATEQEGYGGLVVHGPLQATMLLDLATTALDRRPHSFSFRGVGALLDTGPFSVNAVTEADHLRLWSMDASGRTTMDAIARWS